MMADERIITVRDFKNAGFCAAGVRNWMNLAEQDWRDFVQNGAPESTARRIAGDGIIDRVVASISKQNEAK